MQLQITEEERQTLQIGMYARIEECDKKLNDPNFHHAQFYWKEERAKAYALLNKLGGRG